MNLHEAVVLRTLRKEAFVSQRTLAESCGLSVGAVNKAVKELIAEGFLDSGCRLTGPGLEAMAKSAPKNAIILAAGFGMRMVPINLSTPKALIEVNGERLIERTIRQLHEAGIRDITVVAGFMKDSFEYLIDEFGVDEGCRRQGAASEMIRFIRGYAKEKGYTRIELNMWSFNREALAFYEAAGFATYRRYMESDV